MNLLAVEILLAAYALKRGWRVAPFLLVALPLAVHEGAPTLLGHLEPWLGGSFDPAATTCALAHGLALLGLVVASWASPSEVPVSALFPRPSPRRSGPLYQI